jgi:hypothetical protein
MTTDLSQIRFRDYNDPVTISKVDDEVVAARDILLDFHICPCGFERFYGLNPDQARPISLKDVKRKFHGSHDCLL